MSSTLKDNDGLDLDTSLDRGDDFNPTADADLTDEEKKVAEDLKKPKEKEAAKDESKEEEKDEEKDEDEEDETKGKRRDSRIPISRHKQILEAERAERAKLEAKLAQFEGGEDLAKTNEELSKAETKLIELEGQHAKLITDGKPEEAAKVMGDIRKLERSINKTHLKLETQAAEARAYERARYDVVVERVEAAYPILNPDHDDYDATKARKVLSVMRAYQGDGLTPSAALQEAVKDLLGDPETKQQEKAVDVTPRVTDADAKRAKREEEARRKAADAASRQPSNTKDAGKDSDKLGGKGLQAADVMKMTFTDFSKLDEKTLSSMRGDEVH
jgi:hypothetical protein